ncbi:MAG: aminotransferase class V-fold PLP-dependent enzyme [Cyclobacteriaceae bacterium]|nr:aminotransferase class V-fold PLP-dependent enzyme [Cyclobacteriaceae bacterium SS2]
MDRRLFLRSSGVSIGSAITLPAILSGCNIENPKAAPAPVSADLSTWDGVRAQFPLDHSMIQMAQMLLASHPRQVTDAINRQRQAFDASPATYWEEHYQTAEGIVAQAAAKYMNVNPGEVALTDSTTMGTSILFNGMKLKPGDEILSTTHDHYVTDKSIDFVCEKTGATNRRIDEYADPRTVTVEEVTSNIAKAISDKTRVVMVTWVQSCTGVKLPIRAISDVIREVNTTRTKENRIYFAVDGVHGFGNQDEDISRLGCDFFSAGTHKWIFGPRGTGILFARKDAWDFIRPTIPQFSEYPYLQWMGMAPDRQPTFHELMSPGGFHAFDHRWSLDAAFEFQMTIGRDRVHQRTTALNTRLKQGMQGISGVDLLTPINPELSAGINCFMVRDLEVAEIVKRFHEAGVIASSSPYRISYARLTPCVINTEAEVDTTLEKLERIATIT